MTDSTEGIPPASAAPVARRPRAGAITLLILGIAFTVLSIGPLVGGTALAAADARQGRDDFLYSHTAHLITDSYALTSPTVNLESDLPRIPADVATVKIRVTPQRQGDVFVGLASRNDVDRYLNGVNHTEVTEIGSAANAVEYRDIPGTRAPGPPADSQFWAESSSGAGTREIVTNLRAGDWVLVVMGADAARTVDVNVQAGFRSELFAPLATGLIVLGAVLLLIGVPLLIFGALGVGRNTPSDEETVPERQAIVPAGQSSGYPARLTGTLTLPLSRGLWLVKWVLAIPHYIILAFLWVAFVVTTVVAWFAILFTGRYPRALFNFNVGVIRWHWRVAFYSYSALGTDQYPPFTLASVPYPADYTVEYPERLSRGLVIVKAWLLAIPHLIIVSVITGATFGWTNDNRDGLSRVSGFTLLGALVLIAAVILLFSGRYQRPLFDFIMGLNRWVYRVAAYVALLRDEYPPFRLDQGPDDPIRVSRGPVSGQPDERQDGAATRGVV
jgi:hypothetical protein